jgi:phage RecT family recombinase
MSTEIETQKLPPAQRFASDVEKAAGEYLSNLVGGDAGKRAAARLGMALRSLARATPAIYECDRASVVAAVAMSALTGLEPGGPMPTVYVLPRDISFKDGNGDWKKRKELQWQISFRGMMVLAQRAGYQVRALPVYEGDEFELDLGALRPTHRPAEREEEPKWEELRGVYVVAYQTDTGNLVGWEWLPRWQVEKRRANSDAYRRGVNSTNDKDRSSPWFKWQEEMIRKTGIRYAISRGLVPLDDVAAAAMELDSKADIIDTTAEVVQPATKARKAIGTNALDDALANARKPPIETESVPVTRSETAESEGDMP